MLFDYTDSEINTELASLGYKGVTDHQLHLFKNQLKKLIAADKNRHKFHTVSDIVLNSVGGSRTRGHPSVYNNYFMTNDSSDAGDSFQSFYDTSSKSSMGSLIGENNCHPQMMYGKKEHNEYSRMSSLESSPYTMYNPCGNSLMCNPNLTFAPSEVNLKPKCVQWDVSRESNFDSGSDGSRTGICSFDRSCLFNGPAALRRQTWHGETMAREDAQPQSAETEPQTSNESKIVRNASGIILYKEPPHTRNIYRTKPFERHQMYRRAWKAQPPVGEASRDAVISQIHKHLIQKEVVQWPHKRLTPNPYVVPTTKPRLELRWAVRRCLENYEMPPCGFFHHEV